MTDPTTLPGATLAYIGDAAIEILVRRRLIEQGQTNSGKMSKLALSYVKATEQAVAIERILPFLTEKEEEIYRRGRNANGISAPKSASIVEYRKATGMEALFGWLYLEKMTARMGELFEMAYPEHPESPEPQNK